MPEVSKEEVLAALTGVNDPERGADVVSLGMISGLAMRDGHVTFAIEIKPEEGARKEPLRRACEQAVDRLPGVLSVTAVLTAHREGPAPGAAPRAATGSTPRAAPSRPEIAGVRTIVAVASGKGGVGKSTVAVNLALGLKRLGLRVGLMDSDIYGPSVPRMMGIEGRPQSPDGKRVEPMVGYGIPTMSIGYLVPRDTPMIWRGPMVQSAIEQLLREVNWGELDVLVIDLPPGTGDAQLTLSQRVPLTGAVIVSTPQDVALLDVRKGIAMFERVNVPVLGIVENMSYFVCPHCSGRTDIFGHGGARATAAELGAPFLGEIPLRLVIRETSDAGTPIVVTAPDSEEAAAFMAIAADVAGRLDRLAEEGAAQAPRIVIQ
ncbi:MAG: iron-sulfur cluster carrier protein ApbC [Alphaproteobacteria bacterium]|nr:iron-sulfur cluster carrier protein ApbC [Alphaproteobacteria bacterium]